MSTPLYEQLVKQLYVKNKEQIDALPDDRKRAVLNKMIVKSRGVFKESEVSENTNRQLVAAAAKNRRLGDKAKNMEHQGQPVDRDGIKRQMDGNLAGLISKAEMESSGVVMDRDMPSDWKVGFGADPVADTKAILDDHFDADVNLIQRGSDLVYIDPKTNEPVLVKHGAAAKAAYAIPMVTDVAGTVAGGMVSKQVLKQVGGETVGSFAGSGLGEFVRLYAGSVMGVHELSTGEMFNKAVSHGGEAALWTGGIGGAIAAAKGIKNFKDGGIFSIDEAAKHGLDAKDAQIAIDEFNKIAKRTDGKEFKGTAYQKSGDIDQPIGNVDVGHQEALVRDSSEHSKAYSERLASDQESIAGAADNVLSPQLAPLAGVDDAGKVARDQSNAITGAKEAEVGGLEKQLKKDIEYPSSISHFAVGRHTDEFISSEAKTAQEGYRLAYADAKVSGGFDEVTEKYGIPVPMGENVARHQKVLKERKEVAFTNVGSESSSIFKSVPSKKKGEGVTEKGIDGKRKFRVKDNPKEAANREPDLNFYNDEIGKLKNKQRNIASGAEKSGTSAKELGEIIGSYTEDRAIALLRADKGDLLKKIEDAELAAANYHAKWKKGYVGKLREITDGSPAISRPSMVRSTLNKGREAVEELKTAIGDNPELTVMWKEGVADMYTRKAHPARGFNRQASDDFLDEYGESMELFFSPKEMEKFRKTGDFAESVAKKRAELELYKKNAKKMGLGILSNVSPQGMWKFMKGSGGWKDASAGYGVKDTLTKIKFVKNMTKENTAAFQRLQNDYRKDLSSRIYDPESGYIDHKKFATIVDKERDVIVEMLGKKAFKDLTSINKVVKMANRNPAQSKQSLNEIALFQTLRVYAAPLSPRGRAFTAGIVFKKKAAQSAMAKAVLDERTMHEVAKLAEHSKPTRQFFEKAYSLGLFRENEE